jgi:PAS domain S-box-containing protein
MAVPIRRGRDIHGVISLYARAPRSPDGDVLAALADIGDQIGQFRERTRVSAERDRLASAVEQTADSIVIADRQRRIVYLNTATEREKGYPRESMLGRPLRDLGGELADEGVDAEMWSMVEGGGSWSGVVQGRRSDGTIAQTQLTLSPLRDTEAAFVGAVAVGRDVTRERML